MSEGRQDDYFDGNSKSREPQESSQEGSTIMIGTPVSTIYQCVKAEKSVEEGPISPISVNVTDSNERQLSPDPDNPNTSTENHNDENQDERNGTARLDKEFLLVKIEEGEDNLSLVDSEEPETENVSRDEETHLRKDGKDPTQLHQDPIWDLYEQRTGGGLFGGRRWWRCKKCNSQMPLLPSITELWEHFENCSKPKKKVGRPRGPTHKKRVQPTKHHTLSSYSSSGTVNLVR